MYTLFVVLVVVVIVCAILYFSKEKSSKKLDDLTRQNLEQEVNHLNFKELVEDNKSKSTSPQRGEEELAQLKEQQPVSTAESHLVDKEGASEQLTNQASFSQSSQRVVSGAVAAHTIQGLLANVVKTKTLEEKLNYTYYFHSKEFANAHRYSAAGKFVKVDQEELVDYPSGYKLVVGYAVVGDKDKFSRVEGRRIAELHVNDDKTSYEYPVTVEQLQTPGRTFSDVVKSQVPFTVLSAGARHEARKWYSDFKNWDSAGTPSEESTKELKEYLDKVKKAPHRLLVAEVEVVKCGICGHYDLEVLDVNLNVDVEPKTSQVEGSQQDQHTEQGI